MTKAPLGKRVLAYIIDYALVFVVMFVVIMGGVVVTMVAAMMDSSGLTGLLSLLLIPVYLIVGLLCFCYMLLRDGLFGGRSLGKKLMKLKVVKNGVQPATMVDSLLRNITLCIPLLNLVELIMPFVDADGRRFGDRIANTQVVEA